MTNARRPAKRFAPLNPQKGNNSAAPQLKGIVFDVDGTLCKPQSYMLPQMRQALSLPPTTDILEHIDSLPPAAQADAMASVEAIDRTVMKLQEPQPGLQELIGYLEEKGVRMGLCTRNADDPVTHLLQKFLPGKNFAPIVSRDFRPLKPHPAGILHIASAWGLEDGGEGLIMVGDSTDDMTAGFKAGAATVLLVAESNENGALKEHEHTGLSIERLDDLIQILDNGFEEKPFVTEI